LAELALADSKTLDANVYLAPGAAPEADEFPGEASTTQPSTKATTREGSTTSPDGATSKTGPGAGGTPATTMPAATH
jgi:hypothetical protein